MSSFNGDIWVGTSLGVLKGVSVVNKETLSYLPPGLSLTDTDRSREVMCMTWEGDYRDHLYIGLRNGLVQVFDCNRNYFMGESNMDCGRGHFVGLARHNQTVITCTNEGLISFWPDNEQKSEINVGSSVDVMTAASTCNLLVATGGKENDLKLWDGNRPDAPPIFKARNLPHDSLNLRVPVWVTSMGIVPDTGERPCVAVGTGYHQVRLYDTRANRRPVYNHEWEESKITALQVTDDGRYYLVGNGHGQIARIDLRKGRVINRYHGFGGGITSLSIYKQMFAACGLDRYMRVYQMEPPKLIYKSYMKLQCKCVLMSGLHEPSQVTKSDEQCEGLSVKRKKALPVQEDDDSEEEEDELWDSLDTVNISEKPRKKLKLTK